MEQILKILNEEGLHARPAGNFVKLASGFKSLIEIEANGRKVNGKSIMSVMSLELLKDAEVKLIATGEDEKEAIHALVSLVNRKFAPEAI